MIREHKIAITDGELYYHPDFLSKEESEMYLEILQQRISWQREEVVVFGKRHLVHRCRCTQLRYTPQTNG